MGPRLYIADLRSHASNGKSTGHFIPVAAMYQQLFKDVCEVVVAGGPVYKTRFKDEEMCLLPYNVSGTSLKDKWHTMKNAIKLFKEAKGHTIVIQQGTVVTSFIAVALFFHRTSKLYMIQYSNEGVRSPLKRLLYRFAKKKIDGMICPNGNVGRAYGIPYCVVPDYIYADSGKTVVSDCDCLIPKRYDFCMVGRIAEEKGIVEVASFLANSKYRVVIAGKPSNKKLEEKLRSICENAANIELRVGYVGDGEYRDLLEKSCYTILNYQGEYSQRSSGVVFDTLFAGVPVIGQRCLALEFIEQFDVGHLYSDLTELSSNILDSLLDDAQIVAYKKNICKYKQTHLKYKEKIISFVLSTNVSYLENEQ